MKEYYMPEWAELIYVLECDRCVVNILSSDYNINDAINDEELGNIQSQLVAEYMEW